MNTALSTFQEDFFQALLTPHDEVPEHFRGLVEQPGFAIYRNTVLKGCIDALQANYPTVCRLVGDDWFRAAAALHARAQPPADSRMLLYGADFPQFLQAFAPAADLPYLSGVAALDRCWTEAHVAADAVVLEPSALAGLTLAQLGELVLQPHPAARWAWFEEQPIYTIWQRNRESGDAGEDSAEALVWTGEGALLTRPTAAVRWTALDAGGCAFLDACASGCTLAHAAAAALARQADTDLALLMARLLEAGALCVAAPYAAAPYAAALYVAAPCIAPIPVKQPQPQEPA